MAPHHRTRTVNNSLHTLAMSAQHVEMTTKTSPITPTTTRQMKDDTRPKPTRTRAHRCTNNDLTCQSSLRSCPKPMLRHPPGGTSQTRKWHVCTLRRPAVTSLNYARGPLDPPATRNTQFWLADTPKCWAVIGPISSRHLEPKSVIGANFADIYSAETPWCYGNQLIYRLKFFSHAE